MARVARRGHGGEANVVWLTLARAKSQGRTPAAPRAVCWRSAGFDPSRWGDVQPLQLRETAVDAVLVRDQLVVASELHDPASVDDYHTVRAAHGGEAMGDHEHRPPPHQVRERLLDEELAFRVELRRG